MICDVCINAGHMLAFVFFVYKYACKCITCETFMCVCECVGAYIYLFAYMCGLCMYVNSLVCITCNVNDWSYVHVYIWYLYDCSMLCRGMCLYVVCSCIFVAYVVCCVFACELYSKCVCVVCPLYL